MKVLKRPPRPTELTVNTPQNGIIILEIRPKGHLIIFRRIYH